MIERLVLPHRSPRTLPLVDHVRGGALDHIEDLRRGINLLPARVNQWGEDKVHMLWHDHRSMELMALGVVVNAGGEGNIPSPAGENGTAMSDEGDEMWLVVALQVSELSAVEQAWGSHLSRGSWLFRVSLQPRALLRDQLPDFFHEFRRRHVFGFF